MSGAAGLDLRYPIGGLFVVLGVILAGWGMATAGDAAMYVPTAGINLNLTWGLVMLGTGMIFLLLAWRAARTTGPSGMHMAKDSPEGRAI